MTTTPQLGLGTVQWGLPYGVTNSSGQTPSAEVNEILQQAHQLGIRVLDTASQYGNAEVVLGENDLDGFSIVTKGPSFGVAEIGSSNVNDLIRTFEESLFKLGRNKVYGFLAHHADDLVAPGGMQLIEAMKELKVNGKVSKVGVSVYDANQVDAVLSVFHPDIVQLPLNVFDQRLLNSGHIARLKDTGAEIHVRSAFLQGLLLMPLDRIPTFFDPIRPLLLQWHDAARLQGLTPAQAALAFVRGQPCVDVVIVGVESSSQLATTYADYSNSAGFDASMLCCNEPRFVNPANWLLS